jgi:alkaline phosphatase D
VNLVVVSDHGMVKVQGPWITLDQFKSDDLANFDTAGSLLYAKTEGDADKEYKALRAASPDFAAFRRKNVPAELHYDSNAREGDPVIVALSPVAIRAHGPAAGKEDKPPNKGGHGYDPLKVSEMKASFFAAGPAIRAGVKVGPFENENLYPLLVHILGLESGPVDGKLSVLSSVLVDNGGIE